jgi:hypothetical protein
MPKSVRRYQRMHERGTLPRWCGKVIATRPVPATLIAVVRGHLTIGQISWMEINGFAIRDFERNDPYWFVEHEPSDPMNEYRELMRNDLAESQIHEKERRATLHAAMRYRLARQYNGAAA